MAMPEPEVHTLTGPYVLNALPDDERAGFEAHLADCPACAAEVAELSEAATRLGSAVAAEPPSALKATVTAAVGTTRQLPPLLPADAGAGVTAGAPVVPRRYGRRSLFALAAAGAAIVGAGGLAADQYRDATRARRDGARLAALLTEPDAQTVRGPVTGGGRVTVVMSRQRDEAIVVLDGLVAAPRDRVYQLWFMEQPGHARSVGLLDRSPQHTSMVGVEGGLARAAEFGLTVEPTGGSPEPTSAPIARLKMA